MGRRASRHQGIPSWAFRVANEVVSAYRLPHVELTWYTSDALISTGTCYLASRRISITAGTHEQLSLVTLLHELAHAVVQQAHTREFWDTYYELARRYQVVRLARWREPRTFALAGRRARGTTQSSTPPAHVASAAYRVGTDVRPCDGCLAQGTGARAASRRTTALGHTCQVAGDSRMLAPGGD